MRWSSRRFSTGSGRAPNRSRSSSRRARRRPGSRALAARRDGELRALRDELRDRFGPVPAPVENLISLQQARIALGAAGARTAEVRGGRLSVTPLELDSEQVGRLREAIPEAIYELRHRTLSLRVPDDPAERLAAVLALTDGLKTALADRAGADDEAAMLPTS